jgi:hypothetical protein
MDHLTHNTALEYGQPRPTRLYGALSSAIGAFTCILSVVILINALTYGGGPIITSVGDFVDRLAQGDHLMLLVPGVAVLGIVVGGYGWRRNRTTLSVIGTVLSFWGFVMSLLVSAFFFLFSGMNHHG